MPAVVSILLTPLHVSCPSTTPLHYNSKEENLPIVLCFIIKSELSDALGTTYSYSKDKYAYSEAVY